MQLHDILQLRTSVILPVGYAKTTLLTNCYISGQVSVYLHFFPSPANVPLP